MAPSHCWFVNSVVVNLLCTAVTTAAFILLPSLYSSSLANTSATAPKYVLATEWQEAVGVVNALSPAALYTSDEKRRRTIENVAVQNWARSNEKKTRPVAAAAAWRCDDKPMESDKLTSSRCFC